MTIKIQREKGLFAINIQSSNLTGMTIWSDFVTKNDYNNESSSTPLTPSNSATRLVKNVSGNSISLVDDKTEISAIQSNSKITSADMRYYIFVGSVDDDNNYTIQENGYIDLNETGNVSTIFMVVDGAKITNFAVETSDDKIKITKDGAKLSFDLSGDEIPSEVTEGFTYKYKILCSSGENEYEVASGVLENSTANIEIETYDNTTSFIADSEYLYTLQIFLSHAYGDSAAVSDTISAYTKSVVLTNYKLLKSDLYLENQVSRIAAAQNSSASITISNVEMDKLQSNKTSLYSILVQTDYDITKNNNLDSVLALAGITKYTITGIAEIPERFNGYIPSIEGATKVTLKKYEE